MSVPEEICSSLSLFLKLGRISVHVNFYRPICGVISNPLKKKKKSPQNWDVKNPHSSPPPKIFTSANKMLLYILRTLYLPPDKPPLAFSIGIEQQNHHGQKPLSFIQWHNDLRNRGLIFFSARPDTDLPVAEFCPIPTQTAPGSIGGETSRAFWARKVPSTWSPCP